jgi:serine/threonine protein kinase
MKIKIIKVFKKVRQSLMLGSVNEGASNEKSNKKVLTIHDFNFLATLGTGTFGRVRLVRYKHNPKCDPMALKMLKKTEIIRLKQIDHVKNE